MNTNGHSMIDRAFDFGAHLKTKVVEVPEWGRSFILRELPIEELNRLMQTNSSSRDLTLQLAYTIVDERGNRVYTSPEDLANLAKMSSTVALRLIDEANMLNGSSAEAIEAAKKNSSSPNGDSAGV